MANVPRPALVAISFLQYLHRRHDVFSCFELIRWKPRRDTELPEDSI